jgi:type II secretory pathway pseudopilin PulG
VADITAYLPAFGPAPRDGISGPAGFFSDREDWRVPVAQIVRRLRNALVLVVVLVLSGAILPDAMGQAQHSRRYRDQQRLAQAADKTLREGLHARLPPHISTLLGISSDDKECPVMQSVLRNGRVVKGFDISKANKNDIVLFIADETTNDQTLYLTSPEGKLRRVVSVEAGVGRVRQINEEDKQAFEKEKEISLDRLAPVPASN